MNTELFESLKAEAASYPSNSLEAFYYEGLNAALRQAEDNDSQYRSLMEMKVGRNIDNGHASTRAYAVGYIDGFNLSQGATSRFGVEAIHFSYKIQDGGSQSALVCRNGNRLALSIFLPDNVPYGASSDTPQPYHFRQRTGGYSETMHNVPIGTFWFEAGRRGNIDEEVFAVSLTEACRQFFGRHGVTRYTILETDPQRPG
jgi:hypothetical protein